MVKFTTAAPITPMTQPISVLLETEYDGGIIITLQRGDIRSQALRICTSGKVARLCGQGDKLMALGLAVDGSGYILMNN